MNFSVSGNNNGQIVGKDAYYSAMGDKNDVASEILKSQGGGKEFGFDSGLMVEMSVQQHMGGTIPELKQDITNANVRIGALTSLSSTMNSFLLKTVDMLSDPSFLSGFDVSVSDPLSASAKVNENSGINKPSQFTLDVKQVASAHTITTTEFKPDQPIGKGSLEISLGTYEGKSFTDNRLGAGGLIDIEETDTISTVADKINSANMGVTATIVKTPNGNERLALYSNETGKDHALNIKVAKDDSLSPNNLDSLSYGGENTAVFTEKVSAQNAMFSVNGIDFEYTSNDVKNVMGLDLTITGKTTTPTTISVSQDAKVLVGNVQFFVDNFNGVMDVVSFLDNSTPGEKFQGALHDSKALKDLKQSLSDMNFELAKNGSSLSEIGIKTDEDGFLSLDRKKLEEAVKANPKAINDIFLNKHKSTSHAITVSEIGNTKTGGYFTQNGKYSVEILEKAAPAKLKSEAIAYPVEVNESNNTVKLTVNGIKMDIVLTPGKTYNSSELSLEISNQINRHDKLKAKDDSVIVNTNADGSLEFTSSKNGSKYTFEVNEDNATLGLKATTEKVRGKDVIGNINGVKALGEGDTLTSMFDKKSKGLVLTVDGSAQIGKVETVSIQRGYLNSLKNSMGHMINNEKGAIKSAIKEHEKSIDPNNLDSLVAKLDAAEDKSDKLTKQYWGKYSHVESALSYSASVQNMLDVMYFSNDKDK